MLLQNRLSQLLSLFIVLLFSPILALAEGQGWPDILLEHNTLGHSRSQPIRIRFIDDIVTQANVGESAKTHVAVSSESSWTAHYENRREILITPENTWQSGESIYVTLAAEPFALIAPDLSDYDFSVHIIEQAFDIRIHGLTLAQNDANVVNFSGELNTTDRETDAAAEQVITAKLNQAEIEIHWQHSGNGKTHGFQITDLAKTASKQSLVLSWQTDTIGLTDRGSREIIIPEKHHFGVSSIQGVVSGERYVSIAFTNNLKTGQNLSGLIRLNGNNAKVKTEDNIVKLYIPRTFVGKADVSVEPGIEDEYGKVLLAAVSKSIHFANQTPQVKFSGKGVILPENEFLSIPFETVNVNSVQVTAFQVFEDNIGTFLQNNTLTGKDNLHRVGRYMWRKTIQLPDVEADQWQTFSLDATELFEQSPGGLFRLTLSLNRSNSILSCSEEENAKPTVPEKGFKNFETNNKVESSSWDFAEDYFNIRSNRGDTSNPCEDGYYRWSGKTSVSKNFMASNIGIMAKGNSAYQYNIITTDISSANAMSGTDIEFYNFQDQVIARAKTDADGFANVQLNAKPFYLKALQGNEQGILRLEDNASLPVSHFDVGGETISKGIKGTIFGERGVWRPGDNIYLTFVLSDETDRLPENHPVTMRLYDPRNRLVKTLTNTKPVGNFYRFDFQTGDDDLTGNWEVRAQIGGAHFVKKLKVEMVVPNRLKVELDFGEDDVILKSGEPLQGHLFSQWLHGAKAGNLAAEVSVSLSPQKTHFNRGADFVFDDPTRRYRGNKQYLVDDKLDGEGHLYFDAEINSSKNAPGMLNANFVTKVFESTGQFSTAIQQERFSPYAAYVGIKLPKGDAARGMLLTDTDHTVEVLTLDELGEPKQVNKVSVSLHKIHWKWWWEKGADSLGQYSSKDYTQGLAYDVISTNADGTGAWNFNISYPSWGRYIVRACDLDGGHCTAKVVYIDWPGWAGRAQESKGVGASALTLTTDKPKYDVGDTAFISMPNAQAGRVLVSIENGSKVVKQYWREMDGTDTPLSIPVTADMAPNVYVNAILLQPHSGKENDRPIRMYGVVPVMVENPETRLQPTLDVPEQWGSSATATIQVQEEQGKEMTYSLMVVDEGLLGLTRFRTPDLHSQFYKKEALGIRTWDMFDEIVGAYGGELERLLALGGGDAEDDDAEAKKKRFPPVVRVLGPFKLAAGENAEHQFEMPQYLGQVRVMVVANEGKAYGSTAESVFVREAINVLPTLPRAVSPGESIVVPTLVFRNEQSLESVTLAIRVVEGDARVDGNSEVEITFDDSNEQIGLFNISVGNTLGWATLEVKATSGEHEVIQTVNLPVVSATTMTTNVINKKIEAGETWQVEVAPHGLPGTNSTLLSLSGALPFSLDERLNYLIRYPHGCIEQTTSAVFPQLFLDDISRLNVQQKTDIEKNVKAAIKRLSAFQTNGGGFAYWPGNSKANEWGSNYAGHMMIMAMSKGYSVPDELYSKWLDYQAAQANAWTAGNNNRSVLNQAYRLYTLVLANEADIPAMNRLRVLPNLSPTASQLLAEAYHRFGLPIAADSLDLARPKNFTDNDDQYSYGSAMRNKAIALRSAVVRGDEELADELVMELGTSMATGKWYSTQTVAYTLLAFSEYLGGNGVGVNAFVEHGSLSGFRVTEAKPIYSRALNFVKDDTVSFGVRNDMNRPLYATVLVEGLPKPGKEVAVANKLDLDLAWQDAEGKPLTDLRSLQQGVNITLTATVRNTSKLNVDNLALTEVFPSGWEIENRRFEGEEITEVFDFQDLRDDRVMTYFSLNAGESRSFELTLHTSYAGIFYMPGVNVSAMYDDAYSAATVGQWVEVYR